MAGSMPFSPCNTSDSGENCSDVSVNLLSTIFGPVINKLTAGADPNAVDASSNALASMSAYFGSGLLIIGGLIVSYVAVMGALNTANDGEALGKNWSSLWTPIRIVSGAGVLLPTTSGYSFIQLIVLMIALWGVGFSNGLYKIGVEAGIISGALTNVSAQIGLGSEAKPNPNYPLYDIREFAQNYLATAYCQRTVNSIYRDRYDTSVSTYVSPKSTPDVVLEENSDRTASIYYIRDRNPKSNLAGSAPLCGSLKTYTYNVPESLETTSTVDSIYDPTKIKSNTDAMYALRIAALNAKITAINKVMADIKAWVNTWPTDINQEGWDTVKSNQLNIIVNEAQNTLTAALTQQIVQDATLNSIMQTYVKDTTSDGWMMAGGFYQRLSGIREEMGKIYAEPVAFATLPTLTSLTRDPRGALAYNSYTTAYNTIISKAANASNYTGATAPRVSDFKSTFAPSSLDDLNIDTLGSRGDSLMSNFVGWGMSRVTASLIGGDGDVDAIARIKTVGDIAQLMSSTGNAIVSNVDTAITGLKAAAAVVGSVSFMGTSVDAVPLADTFLQWVQRHLAQPVAKMLVWLDLFAFYFGVFLPSLPYTIFMVACVGWLLAVFQSAIAAPLWAIMHMTPDRTFVGSQTQGYLLLLSLFVRPALIILGLFAAMAIANPVLMYISKAFWAMREAIVTSSESLGWLMEFFSWRNWLVMYGLLLLPIMYMIFGLSQSLPDVVLKWIGAGISSMGETQATEQMRTNTEKHGPNRGLSSGGPQPSVPKTAAQHVAGYRSGSAEKQPPTSPKPPLLLANGQGVAPIRDVDN
ncbi:membrane protein [Pseudomonas asuensis]|uniref:Membrane protein n=1 Tax=Pseudomonas asuensis TaxID=1825787 RepID=A0ABQ2H4A2_9PSED|nr:DotA/TraY family protein [Pseudomonas asuensis]GGM30820.1 membrane protein [Pseudomonas asuensis]